jgi:hypothetical protein
MYFLVTADWYDEDQEPQKVTSIVAADSLEEIATALDDFYNEKSLDNINIQHLSDYGLVEIPNSIVNEVKHLVP